MRDYKYAIRELYLYGRSAEEIETAIILGYGGNAAITKEERKSVHDEIKKVLREEFGRGEY